MEMMLLLESYVRRGNVLLRRWALDTRVHRAVRAVLYTLGGFVLSAASLGNYSLPLAMGLVCACGGWSAVLAAAGACLGYGLLWGSAGQAGIVWSLLSLPVGLILSKRSVYRQTPLMAPAVAGLIVAATGVAFQLLSWEMPPIPVYLLRIGLGAGSAMVFTRIFAARNPILEWIALGFGVLALSQLMPIPYLGLGYLAAGWIVSAGAFPAAALAGLALDLAQVTPVSMTAVLTLAYLIRFLPRYPKWLASCMPVTVYIAVMNLWGTWDIQPVAGLLIGSLLGTFLPIAHTAVHRRGETGVAQVRLEMAAGVFNQMETLLLDVESAPVDEEALVMRSAERACNGCAYRKNCRDAQRVGQLPSVILHKPLLSTEELPIICRKPGRLLAELHRCQEQLRSIQADRRRQEEYRAALIQQYRFVAVFLQELSDRLPRRPESAERLFQPQVQIFSNRQEQENGDRCVYFAGVGKKYYVLLCDGMGTGADAALEGKMACAMLQKMLSAGYPAQYALRSLNSLCALRGRAGVVTVDLAEILLDSGKVSLYKWGAAPSYITTPYGAQKIGVPTPPPGLDMEGQERVERTGIRRGAWLVMVSDGVSPTAAFRCCMENADRTAGELAQEILACGQPDGQDDATVVIVRLKE